MATVAIGDIHGNLPALEDLLAKLLPGVTAKDELVLLGDYVDRGTNVRGCLDRIVRLKNEAPCPVVALIGNHEDWMLKSLQDPTSHSWILGMEAFATIASYSADAAVRLRQELEQAGMRLITRDRARISYEVFFDLVPNEHMEFLKNLKPFHCNADVVCVHGGVLDDSPVHLQDPQTLIWGPHNFPDEYNGHETVVYGHWNNPVIDESGWPWPRAKANHTFGIDTISHGVLTAMSFPDGKIFQSNRYPIADEIH